MFVRIEVVHTVFIIALAFGAVPKLQIVSVQFRPPAHCAAVMSPALRLDLHLRLKFLLAPDLFGIHPAVIAGYDKEQDKV